MIFSNNVEEHIKRIEGVFQRLGKHNLKVKPSKCEFFMTEVKYLGHVVSEQGIRTNPDKTEIIKTWPVPYNIKQLRSFLGFAGYYRRFVKDYSKIVKPFKRSFGWPPYCKVRQEAKKARQSDMGIGPTQQSAFDIMVQKLTSPPVLAYADFKNSS